VEAHFETRLVTDAADLAGRLAEGVSALSQGNGAERVAVALAGGNTPKLLYETLAVPPWRERVRWERLDLFFGDERAVPPAHPDSNYGMVQEALLSRVSVAVHRMPAERGDAEAYARLLGERVGARRDGFPVFDLVLLGMGKDGHTASLFPGTAALDEQQRWVVMNEVPQLATRRMTLTYPVFNRARRVWVLISGRDKREILSQCLAARTERGRERQWPILGVRPAGGELIWWMDRAAAGAAAPGAAR
jgi:6-phosphogluconolactonase